MSSVEETIKNLIILYQIYVDQETVYIFCITVGK